MSWRLALCALLGAATGMAKTYTYWIEPCNPKASACQADDPELAEWALAAWQRAGNSALRFENTADRDKALLRFYWAGGRSGLYGEARPIRVNGELGAEIYIRGDLSHLGDEMQAIGRRDPLFRHAIVYLTCLHESGHALGLAHTTEFDDIMYSFQYGGDIVEYFMRYRRRLSGRQDIRNHSGMSASDAWRLRRLVGE